MENENEKEAPITKEEARTLSSLLRESLAVSQHQQSWLDAANRGAALHRLRDERARHGSGFLPVWDYLADLSKLARVSLDSVLAAFQLDSQPVVGSKSAERIAEVLVHIGCPAPQVEKMLRLSFAEVHGYAARPAFAALFRGAQNEDSCDEALRHIEGDYPEELKQELQEVRAAVARVDAAKSA